MGWITYGSNEEIEREEYPLFFPPLPPKKDEFKIKLPTINLNSLSNYSNRRDCLSPFDQEIVRKVSESNIYNSLELLND